ncbi:hypothetical protein PHMEG_00040029, partial [Phytophthora megakarya]
MIRSGIISTGEVCIRVYSDTWGNVSTVKHARKDLESRASHPATHPFQIIAWIIYPRYLDPSTATLNC